MLPQKRGNGLVIAGFLFAALITLAAPVTAGWSSVTVDSVGDVGWGTSLALDSAGNPRISYRDNSNADLKYAEWTGGSWTITTVDSGANVAEYYTSLALDSAGNPRISYHDYTNHGMKYAERNGGSWTITTVDSSGYAGLYSSLALDGYGNPRISYCRDFSNLRYAERNGGSWTITTVDSGGNLGTDTSLALDSAGNPRISYYGNSDLKFAKPVPVVDLSGSPLSGAAPLTVTFTGSATNTLGSPGWGWSFGDGSTSPEQNPPAHTYTATGTYSVSLAVSDSIGMNVTPRTAYITVTDTTPATAIAVDPSSASTVYAGIDTRGIYRTTDGGSSWSPATTQPGNLHIRALVISPPDRTHLFTGTYGGGVNRSVNSGVDWLPCTNNGLANLNTLSLVSDSAGRLYAGTEGGVFTSTDGCTNWVAVNNGLP